MAHSVGSLSDIDLEDSFDSRAWRSSTRPRPRAKSPSAAKVKESKAPILKTLLVGLLAVVALYGFLAYIINKETSVKSGNSG